MTLTFSIAFGVVLGGIILFGLFVAAQQRHMILSWLNDTIPTVYNWCRKSATVTWTLFTILFVSFAWGFAVVGTEFFGINDRVAASLFFKMIGVWILCMAFIAYYSLRTWRKR